MMKRVGFGGFKHFEVSRKIPLCLRLGSVDGANGESKSCDKCSSNHSQRDSDVACTCEELRKENCDYQRTKSNIFNSIRKKWRRHKRNKRSETRKRDQVINVCQSQLGEENSNCMKHQRFKNQKICVSQVNCNNNNSHSSTGGSEDAQKSSSGGANEESEDCSCFGSPTRKTFSSLTAKVVKLKSQASKSMSDITTVTATVSSPTAKTDSENDICRILASTDPSANISCPDGLSLGSQDDMNTSFNQEASNDTQFEPKFGVLTQELHKLSKYGWYWGPINRSEADSKLVDQPDGAFLVRDSSDDRYILSLSFRSCGKTLHTRIEHNGGLFSFYSHPEPEGHTSIVELINQSMNYSKSGAFCYSRGRVAGYVSYPVRLTKPISRFTQVRSLQYLCRFIIRQHTRYDHIQKLPLPERIKGYLEKVPY